MNNIHSQRKRIQTSTHNTGKQNGSLLRTAERNKKNHKTIQ
jgi:hypothetical protein